MQFVQNSYIPGDTIAAICTPPGEGGVAMVRITGDRAIQVADQVFSGDVSSYTTHTLHYGVIRDDKGEHVDDVLLAVMLGSRSYCGEETVEVSCHGGTIVTRKVLEAILSAGARPAQPGEFTLKAFMNGKLDLAQAEAVQELIHAKNEHALQAAEQQLRGRLSREVAQLQKEVTLIAAIVDAWIDFPEEGLEFSTPEALLADLSTVRARLQRLIETFHDGRIVRDGINLCLVGSPNVGKSSLMNALLDKERAIVSEQAGTTRDIVEDHMRLNGLNFRLTDTAGLRETVEEIEAEGIRRSRVAMLEADLVLVVLDAKEGMRFDEQRLIAELPKEKTIVAWNKCDLATPQEELPFSTVCVSAKERSGLQALHKAIDEVVWDSGPPARDEVVVTSQRHREALIGAAEGIDRFLQGMATEISPEFLAIELRESLCCLGRILGTDVGEDILSAIFSTFCVGK